jgi:hypothetical protein
MEGSLSQRERAGVREIANLPDGLTLFPVQGFEFRNVAERRLTEKAGQRRQSHGQSPFRDAR